MKRYCTTTYIALMAMVFSSCSSTSNLTSFAPSSNVARVPAQAHPEMERAFTFTSAIQDEASDYSYIKHEIDQFLLEGPVENRVVEFIEVKTLPNKAAYKIELTVQESAKPFVYKIYHTPQAFKDRLATSGVRDFLDFLMNSEKIKSGGAPFEMYYNALQGNSLALERFVKIRLSFQGFSGEIPPEAETLKHELKSLRELSAKLSAEVKASREKTAKAKAKRKSLLAVLDTSPEGNQFRAYVAKNDRKGAVGILRKYLPWEDMAPFEKKYWEDVCDIILNPVPLDQRVIIYRGLDGDYRHRAIVDGKELTEKEAMEKSQVFIMSTLVTKNQGSWNRRLRSLEAMYSKDIATAEGDKDYAQVSRISTLFGNHADAPLGSPFLSFSPSFSVASSFGNNYTAGFLIDPRLLSYNYASPIFTEIEFLIPLTTFPEDLIAMADNQSFNWHSEERQKHIMKGLSDKIKKAYPDDARAVLTKIKKNTHQFFSSFHLDLENPKGPATGPINLKFYKPFLKEGLPVPTMTKAGELACSDLIRTFWMDN